MHCHAPLLELGARNPHTQSRTNGAVAGIVGGTTNSVSKWVFRGECPLSCPTPPSSWAGVFQAVFLTAARHCRRLWLVIPHTLCSN
eukprot:3290485-Amphidinium_carterae.4